MPPDLEQRVRHIEQDVGVIKSNYASREDVKSVESTMVKWYLGSTIALAGVVVAAIALI